MASIIPHDFDANNTDIGASSATILRQLSAHGVTSTSNPGAARATGTTTSLAPVARSQTGSLCPVDRLNLSATTASPILANYHSALVDPNWRVKALVWF